MILGDDSCKKDLFDYDSLFDNGVGIQIKVGLMKCQLLLQLPEELTSQSYLIKGVLAIDITLEVFDQAVL